jgi:hypothetical protein
LAREKSRKVPFFLWPASVDTDKYFVVRGEHRSSLVAFGPMGKACERLFDGTLSLVFCRVTM